MRRRIISTPCSHFVLFLKQRGELTDEGGGKLSDHRETVAFPILLPQVF